MFACYGVLQRIVEERGHPHDGDEGARPHHDRDDTTESLLLPSGDATLCVLTPDGDLIELVPILEPEMPQQNTKSPPEHAEALIR
ncbi:unnamed protein product [marine sediment metagenome]|uniref:Uncharacterized protein n=1 Tax=marine sediment metagenome TaxID=412755 RepID=X0Y794_9ZZZZ